MKEQKSAPQNSSITYSGAAGYVDLVATADGYLGSIDVKHIAEPEANVENFTFVMDEHAVDGVVKTGEYKFGDSTLTLGGTDSRRSYYSVYSKAR